MIQRLCVIGVGLIGGSLARALRAAGVNVAAGADNLQDPFNPLGRACPFATAGLMMLTTHLLPLEAWETVSVNGTRALAGSHRVGGLHVGAPADLLAVRADTLREAIATAPHERSVWRSGHRTRVAGPLET